MVDYKDVLLTLVPMAPRTQHLCSFLCELSLLHTSLAAYAPAHLAAAALLLARLTHGQSKELVLPTSHSEHGLSQWSGGFLESGASAQIQGGWREKKKCVHLLEKETPEWTKSHCLGVRLETVLA